MRRLISFLFAMISCLAAFASADLDECIVVNRWSISAGKMLLADHSLSDMQYKGVTVGIHGNHGTFFRNSTRWSWEIYDKVAVSPMLINPARTNLISNYSFLVGYGANYNFFVDNKLGIKLGPALEAFGGWKSSPRYINNSLSVDASLQLALSVGICYFLNFHSWALNVGWSGTVPFAGLMFVPSDGMTPAQVVWKKAWKKALHFSSIHNNQAISASLWFDFHLKSIGLRLALMHGHHWWHSSGIQYYTKDVGMQLGVIVELVMHGRNQSNRYYFD